MSHRQSSRKGSLTTKGNSSLLSKVGSTKKTNEILKKPATKIPNLPTLNLSKVRRTLFDPAELEAAGYATARGIRTPGKEVQVSPRIHSARFSTSEGVNLERESIARGSLTDRGGSLTDRGCKENSGNLHVGNLRNRKENTSDFLGVPKLKLDIQSKQVFQQDSTKSSNEKERVFVKNSAHSAHVSNLSSNLNSLSGCLTSRRQKVDASFVKNSSLTSRSYVNPLPENIDSKLKSGSVSQRMGNDPETPRPRTAKVDTIDWEVKKISSHILCTLEEALAKVKKSSSEKKASARLGSADESSAGLAVSRTKTANKQSKSVLNSDKPARLKEIRQLSELCENLVSSKRTSNTTTWDNGNRDTKERLAHEQSKTLKVKPLKLPLANNQTSVPLGIASHSANLTKLCKLGVLILVLENSLKHIVQFVLDCRVVFPGFGSNPVENVQTSRIFHPPIAEPSPRMAYTDRDVSHKSSAEDARSEVRKTNAASFPILSIGVSMNPQAVLRQYANHLTEYEHREILSYNEIHFIGTSSQKHQASEALATCNYGYDDERGDYNIVEHDHLAYRYEVLGMLGKGSFGQVVKCHDHKYKVLRAVKMVRNKKRFHQQALIEVKILEHLRDKCNMAICHSIVLAWSPQATEENANYNIVTIFESFYFRGHLCICFALHDISLYELIKRNNFQGLSLIIIKSFATQLLTTLKFLRKLVYTYIQSRFYRSPEVILGLPYDMMIDVWSLGCILAELYTGYPLFAGENEVEQLACIMEVLGTPPASILEKATRKKMFFDSNDNPRIVPNSWGKKHWPGEKTIASAIVCTDPLFINFLESCLRWDKDQRSTPDELLRHPWILRVQNIFAGLFIYTKGFTALIKSRDKQKKACSLSLNLSLYVLCRTVTFLWVNFSIFWDYYGQRSVNASDVPQMPLKPSKQKTSNTVKHHSTQFNSLSSAKNNPDGEIEGRLVAITRFGQLHGASKWSGEGQGRAGRGGSDGGGGSKSAGAQEESGGRARVEERQEQGGRGWGSGMHPWQIATAPTLFNDYIMEQFVGGG
eukprot:Gb_19741 [translate_table: standard]